MAGPKITEIRILPPLAVGRLGSSESPMDNYRFDGFTPAEDDPTGTAELGYRKLVPAQTLNVDPKTYVITPMPPTGDLKFRDPAGKIKPVCPFLEVWALVEGSPNLQPLTLKVLADNNLKPSDITWNVEAVNSKAYRRTNDKKDKIKANTGDISDHKFHNFDGICANFLPNKSIYLGGVQYIKPNTDFPEIRLRFTPAPGKVYGPDQTGSKNPKKSETTEVEAVYDPTKGWNGFYNTTIQGHPDKRFPSPPTQPGAIYWGYDDDDKNSPSNGLHVSSGFLDDMCDGLVSVRIEKLNLKTYSRISVGPPDFAPDSLPIRSVADELKQIDQGPEVGNVTAEQAEDILRRALETVRLLNAYAMNGSPLNEDGNPIDANGHLIDAAGNVIDDSNKYDNHNTNNMAVQNYRDTGGETQQRKKPANDPNAPDPPIEPDPDSPLGRAWSPIFNPPTGLGATNGEVTAPHRRLLKLILENKPLFGRVRSLLREYDQTGDYTDPGREQMPGLMRSADGMLLALTRQMQSLLKAATVGYSDPVPPDPPVPPGQINPKNRTAQIEHLSKGNPPGTLLTTAVSNNFPGLEFDYRSIWRKVFKDVIMYEAGPRVVEVKPGSAAEKAGVKAGMLMFMAGGETLWADVRGPHDEGSSAELPWQTQGLEWSNAIAKIVHQAIQTPGNKVECVFVNEPAKPDPKDSKKATLPYTLADLMNQKLQLTVALEVQPMFPPELGEGNAVFGNNIVDPGDLTQGLCSPWQNDYRECSCYYWAAARPDFVSRTVTHTSGGDEVTGENWLQKPGISDGNYLVDDRTSDSQLAKFVSYTELFDKWEEKLGFVIAGQKENLPKA